MSHTLKKLSRGSILAYSLILLGIVLTASIGMMAASITNLKSVSSSDKSMNAFQVADSGSQIVVRMLKESSGNELQDVSGVTCDEGDAVVESPASFLAGGSYRVIFQDGDGKTLKCTDNIFDVASVKSVGTYSDTARAVQVAVAAGSCGTPGQVVTVRRSNDESYSPSDSSAIGTFLNEKRNRLVGFSCWYSANNMAGGGAAVYNFSPAPQSIGLNSTAFGATGSVGMHCGGSSPGACKVESGPTYCVSGWAIYGMCTDDI